jgi:hypothetical protein
MTSQEIFVTDSLHMENPTIQLFLKLHYICMHALTLKVRIFYLHLALSLISLKYWFERWSGNIVADTFSSIGTQDQNTPE